VERRRVIRAEPKPNVRVVRVAVDVVLPVGDTRDRYEIEDLVLRTLGTLSAEPTAYDVLSLRAATHEVDA
jgi:hypothetical protein